MFPPVDGAAPGQPSAGAGEPAGSAVVADEVAALPVRFREPANRQSHVHTGDESRRRRPTGVDGRRQAGDRRTGHENGVAGSARRVQDGAGYPAHVVRGHRAARFGRRVFRQRARAAVRGLVRPDIAAPERSQSALTGFEKNPPATRIPRVFPIVYSPPLCSNTRSANRLEFDLQCIYPIRQLAIRGRCVEMYIKIILLFFRTLTLCIYYVLPPRYSGRSRWMRKT